MTPASKINEQKNVMSSIIISIILGLVGFREKNKQMLTMLKSGTKLFNRSRFWRLSGYHFKLIFERKIVLMEIAT